MTVFGPLSPHYEPDGKLVAWIAALSDELGSNAVDRLFSARLF